MQRRYFKPYCLFLSFFELEATGSAKKRLLLTDPIHLQQEIDDLKSRLQAMETDNTAQKTKIKQLESQIVSYGRGDIFIHWGKKTCNNATSTLIYSEFAGGSGYADSGSSSKNLCLPPDPTLISHGLQEPNAGFIYGTEYEMTQLDGINPHNQDVPCSVCITHPGTRVLMIPARNRCYNGWTEIYNGYLVGNRNTDAAAIDHVCLDKNPSFILGGGANNDGRLFHLQRTRCGSLKCPPYENDKYVTCVVCGYN